MIFFTPVSTLKSVLVSVILSAALLASTAAHAQLKCSLVLGVDLPKREVQLEGGKVRISPELGKLIIKAAEAEINTPTANRGESKRTVTTAKALEAMGRLNKTLNLKVRDTVQPGTKNVTVTIYRNPLIFQYQPQDGSPAKDLTAKPRNRKYGTIRDDQEYALENVQYIPGMDETSFVELKTEHPIHKNSVLKPRGKQDDRDLKLIGTPEFLNQKDSILERAISHNSKNETSIQTMTGVQKFFIEAEKQKVPMNFESLTMYERTAYFVRLANPQTKEEFQIEMTMDEMIRLYSFSHDRWIDAYKSETPLSVVEVKIPVVMLDPHTGGFKAELLKDIPRLQAVAEFLNELTEAQAPGYELNKGKQSLIRGHLEPRSP
jgi:hypothetical protein